LTAIDLPERDIFITMPQVWQTVTNESQVTRTWWIYRACGRGCAFWVKTA
jgi:hypothetical protein